MSATTEFVLTIEDFTLGADAAATTAASNLATLSNLVWRAGRMEGPDLQVPLAETDDSWIAAMRDQLQDALASLAELEAANSSLRACS